MSVNVVNNDYKPGDAGGWPSLASARPPPDGDGDGMPDAWEVRKGLDPHDSEDRNRHALDAAYTNLETYVNELAGDTGKPADHQ